MFILGFAIYFMLITICSILSSRKVTITGKNIINCRPFNIQSNKAFEFIGSFKSEKSIPSHTLPEIAFVGRSNVGKSSLLNCLTGMNKKVAVQSKTPGCTQSINLYKCRDNEGDICMFVDLPGYGFAKMSRVQQDEVSKFLRDYLSNRACLRLVTLLVDIRRETQPLDQQMLQFLRDEGLPYLIVATKADKMSASETKNALTLLGRDLGIAPKFPVPFSSVTSLGRKDVWHAIRGGILGDASLLSGCLTDDDDDEQDEDENNYIDNLEDDEDSDDGFGPVK